MVMLVRCEGEDEEEVDNDEESSERLIRGLTHQCSLALKVQGLSTGYCKDIHGQVRWLVCLVLYREKQVKASYEKENSKLKCVCCPQVEVCWRGQGYKQQNQRKLFQYKVHDKGASFFARGTSNAVL